MNIAPSWPWNVTSGHTSTTMPTNPSARPAAARRVSRSPRGNHASMATDQNGHHGENDRGHTAGDVLLGPAVTQRRSLPFVHGHNDFSALVRLAGEHFVSDSGVRKRQDIADASA
jgi:hypothetical protein